MYCLCELPHPYLPLSKLCYEVVPTWCDDAVLTLLLRPLHSPANCRPPVGESSSTAHTKDAAFHGQRPGPRQAQHTPLTILSSHSPVPAIRLLRPLLCSRSRPSSSTQPLSRHGMGSQGLSQGVAHQRASPVSLQASQRYKHVRNWQPLSSTASWSHRVQPRSRCWRKG